MGWSRRGSWRRWGTRRARSRRPRRSGRLHRVHRGVYAVGHATAHLARALHGGGARLVSPPSPAISAAWLWGLLRSTAGTDPPHRADPARSRRQRPFRRALRARPRPEPTVDAARRRDPGHLARADRSSTSRRRSSPDRLERALERAEELEALRPARRSKSCSPARAATRGTRRSCARPSRSTDRTQPSPARSSSAASASSCGQAGLPAPAMNFIVAGYRDRRLLGRGRASRSNSTSTRRTASRARPSSTTGAPGRRAAAASGSRRSRVTGPRSKREPEAVMARLRDALARRRARARRRLN